TSQRARTWCTLDFDLLYQQYQAERGRVVTALEWLQEKGWIELESKQMTEVYAVLAAGFDSALLAAELHAYFQRQEGAEIGRIHAMLALFESQDCLSRRLAEYFGDARAPRRCGHCSVCLGAPARLPAPPALPPLSGRDRAGLCGEFSQRHQALTGRQ